MRERMPDYPPEYDDPINMQCGHGLCTGDTFFLEEGDEEKKWLLICVACGGYGEIVTEIAEVKK